MELNRGELLAFQPVSPPAQADFAAFDCLTDRDLARQVYEQYLPPPRLGGGF